MILIQSSVNMWSDEMVLIGNASLTLLYPIVKNGAALKNFIYKNKQEQLVEKLYHKLKRNVISPGVSSSFCFCLLSLQL